MTGIFLPPVDESYAYGMETRNRRIDNAPQANRTTPTATAPLDLVCTKSTDKGMRTKGAARNSPAFWATNKMTAMMASFERATEP